MDIKASQKQMLRVCLVLLYKISGMITAFIFCNKKTTCTVIYDVGGFVLYFRTQAFRVRKREVPILAYEPVP